jgi:hypothetical protein
VSNFFLSLFLAASVSFAAPVLLVGGVLGLLTLTSHIPGFLAVSDQGMLYILNFLAVFGDGKPLQGIATLGITLSIVGILLDILNFYRYQSLRDKDFS